MAINDSFGNLVTDITQQVLEQVQQQVQSSITAVVNQRISEVLSDERVGTIISNEVIQRINNFHPDMTDLDNRVIAAGDRIISELNIEAEQKINDIINNKIGEINLEGLVHLAIDNNLRTNGQHLALAPNTIPGTAIKLDTLTISGDNIVGGTYKNFSSTGIDDKATTCQLTIMDVGTIFENTLYAARVEVKGDAVIDGNLIIKGEIPKDSQTYINILADVNNIADASHERLLNRLQNESLDISKLTMGQRSIIEGNTLTTTVLHSNLQSVGVLKDLQTAGETLLSETLYTTSKRVGINTMDPSLALSIWDEEIQIDIGKQSQNTAQISTPRGHSMILGSNGQKNITLTTDGAAVIPKLQIGNMQFSTAAAPPATNDPKGTVVFNENPSLGGPMGWISLGDARWANFGIID